MQSKTAIFHSSQAPCEIVNVSIPPLKKGEILVRNSFVTLCRSDLNTYCGKRKEKSPTILGHEVVGNIMKFGPDAPFVDLRGEKLAQGDRITWAIFASNPLDKLSQAGIPQKAAGLFKYGHELNADDSTLHGGLSEYTILREHTPFVKLQGSIKDKTAAIINCAVATVAGAIRISGEIADKKILVSGAGMLGLIACAMLKANGAAEVFVLDQSVQRLNFARNFGIDGQIHIHANGDGSNWIPDPTTGFDITYDFTGVTNIMEYNIKALEIGGVAVLVGATHPQPPLKIDAELIVRHLLSIRGLHNYNVQDLVSAVDFMEEHHDQFPFDQMICGGYKLNEVNEAFEFALRNNPFRVGIDLQKT